MIISCYLMETNMGKYDKLEINMKILQDLNTDDSRFLYRICKKI